MLQFALHVINISRSIWLTDATFSENIQHAGESADDLDEGGCFPNIYFLKRKRNEFAISVGVAYNL